jgi:hypothetical protein
VIGCLSIAWWLLGDHFSVDSLVVLGDFLFIGHLVATK